MNEILKSDFARILDRIGSRLAPLNGQTILITGYSGLIGAYLVEFFVYANANYFKERVKIIGIDNHVAGEKSRLDYLRDKPGLDLRFGDIADDWRYKNLLNVDYVIHAASIAAPEFYKKKPLETIRANVIGTWILLYWAARAGVKSCLHMSSSEAYGEPTIIPTPEHDCGQVNFTSSRAVYDESKRIGETLAWTFHDLYGFPIKTVRPFNIFGPGQRLDDGRVFPNLMKALLNNETFTIYGDGTSTRSYCYISDAICQLLVVLLEGKNGEAYNLGDGESEVSLAQLAELANKVFDGRPAVEVKEAPEQTKDAPKRRRPDLSKILEFAPKAEVELGEGLRRTYEYYKS